MSVWLWLAAAAAAGTALFLALMWWVGRGGTLPKNRLTRMLRLSKLAAGFSTSWLGARLRRLVARGEDKRRVDADARERNAKRLADAMGNMKGAFMKLGQMLSFVSDSIPAEYQSMLATLQAEAPPLDFPSIRDMLESELGQPLERAFAEFDTEPVAAASIGQVHRAVLPDGRAVAVKVQYPGIAGAIASDLANVGMLYRIIGMMYPGLDPKPVVDELRDRIGEELDYSLEARSQRLFARLYDGHPVFRIPAIIDDYSTRRVLTSEFVTGRRYADIAALDQPERDRYGEILYRFVFGTTLRFRAFNGDPHPGNYIFDDEGRIVFIDFGLTKYFPPDMLKPWRQAVLAYMAGDREAFASRLRQLSFVGDGSGVGADTLYDYFTYFYDCWRADRKFTFTEEYNAKSFAMIFAPQGQFAGLQKKLNMPRDFVFVNRIQWGVMSILAGWSATGNWHRIHREYMFGDEPSTDMGAAIAGWRRKWLAVRPELEKSDIFLSPEGLNSEELDSFPLCWSA